MARSRRHIEAQESVLEWYSKAARPLPWRVSPKDRAQGHRPNPYHVWLSEIMLQQTTVATVKPYFERFTLRWPTVSSLAKASRDEVMTAWAGLGYYARARHLHKTAQIIADEFSGNFPEDEKTLLKLSGIGTYTAAAISAFAYGHETVVVDGNIERITARWGRIETPLPKAKIECRQIMKSLTPKGSFRAGDFAQALMDIASSICTTTSPDCRICPLSKTCKAKDHAPARLPIKAPKKPRADRFGHVLIIKDSKGHVAVMRRPDKGMLGGLDIFPTNDWPDGGGRDEEEVKIDSEFFGQGMILNESVSHIFTHFRVLLTIEIIQIDKAKPPLPTINNASIKWIKIAKLRDHALPTVMVKCAKVAKIL